jgi:hypothetical protein
MATATAADIRPSWAVEQVAALVPRAWLVLIPGVDPCQYRTHPGEVRARADALLRALPHAP